MLIVMLIRKSATYAEAFAKLTEATQLDNDREQCVSPLAFFARHSVQKGCQCIGPPL